MRNRESFESHALWSLVSELKESERIGGLPTELKSYLIFLLEDIGSRRDAANPYYVSASALDDVKTNLSNVKSYLNSGNHSQMYSYIDRCFDLLAQRWPANNGRRSADIAQSTAEKMMSHVDDAIARSEADAAELASQTKAFTDELEADRSRIKTANEESLKAIAESRSIAEERCAKLSEEAEGQLRAIIESVEKDASDAKDDCDKSLAKILDEASHKLDLINRRTGRISGLVVAEDYGRYARNKAIACVVYDVAAVAFAVLGIFAVAYAFMTFGGDQVSTALFKFAASVASFTVSGYLFRRGSHNQKEAKAAKRTDLTLREVERFTAAIPDKQEEILGEVARRIFIDGDLDCGEGKTQSFFQREGLTEKDVALIVELLKAVKAS